MLRNSGCKQIKLLWRPLHAHIHDVIVTHAWIPDLLATIALPLDTSVLVFTFVANLTSCAVHAALQPLVPSS
jgi:hypothetical protein